MSLLERVTTLVRANLNDLIDQAEDPEKLVKQVILDMENQLLQVKTQVAVTLADQHILERKRVEYAERVAEWTRRAELAVDRKQDDLARAALERTLSFRRMAASCEEQVADQAAQVEHLKTALRKLEQKLAEARAQSELLIAHHRRARALGRTGSRRGTDGAHEATFRRMRDKVARSEAVGAAAELVDDSVEHRLAALEEEEKIDRLLAELKARRGAG